VFFGLGDGPDIHGTVRRKSSVIQTSKILARDEPRRIAANVVKLPELMPERNLGPALMSAFGGKADISSTHLDVRY
jgi:hypothetical protein